MPELVIVHGHLSDSPETVVTANGCIEILPRIGDRLAARVDVERVRVFTAEGQSPGG